MNNTILYNDYKVVFEKALNPDGQAPCRQKSRPSGQYRAGEAFGLQPGQDVRISGRAHGVQDNRVGPG